jgi:phosphomannomutase
MSLTCFKAYDIRGRMGRDLDEDVAARIGFAVTEVMTPGTVVVGRDPRESSDALVAALSRGLASGGVESLDLGLCGTEEVYFATEHVGAGAGIMVTASHNPIDYNGMKLVGPGSRPLTNEEFRQIEQTAESSVPGETAARRTPIDVRTEYAGRVCGFIDAAAVGEFRLLANSGNGSAGPTFDRIADELAGRGLSLDAVRLHHQPDGRFPNGIPNPLLPENRGATAAAVVEAGANMGVAWDGDFDRCFFFDGEGQFVDGEYVVALLAESVLSREPGATIVHDPRVLWATTDAVERGHGRAVVSRTGHAHLKATMRAEKAAYGGEMSAHHYFRDFAYCDSGMIPWLLVMARIAETGASLTELVADRRARFPSSGEINFRVDDPHQVIDRVVDEVGGEAEDVDRLDGASLTFGAWRMNLRASSTEPLLRLNVETRGDRALLSEKVDEISRLIEA